MPKQDLTTLTNRTILKLLTTKQYQKGGAQNEQSYGSFRYKLYLRGSFVHRGYGITLPYSCLFCAL